MPCSGPGHACNFLSGQAQWGELVVPVAASRSCPESAAPRWPCLRDGALCLMLHVLSSGDGKPWALLWGSAEDFGSLCSARWQPCGSKDFSFICSRRSRGRSHVQVMLEVKVYAAADHRVMLWVRCIILWINYTKLMLCKQRLGVALSQLTLLCTSEPQLLTLVHSLVWFIRISRGREHWLLQWVLKAAMVAPPCYWAKRAYALCGSKVVVVLRFEQGILTTWCTKRQHRKSWYQNTQLEIL